MNIDVKHRGTTHRLTVDLNATLDQVRHELYAVTGVPAERQKLLHKSLMRIDWAHGEGARLTVGKVFAGGSRTGMDGVP